MTTAKPMVIHVSKLLLDPANPRHDPIDDEPEIIAYLFGKERVMALAKKIVQLQGVSPLERMAVIERDGTPGKYLALEGNRRLCALKLLMDPEKAPTARARTALRALVAGKPRLPTQVDAILFPSREAARPWIGLRHEGEQEGAGTKKWNASQTARYNLAGNNPNNQNALALALLDYARDAAIVSQEERDALALTTVQRYLNSPVFRHALGLSDSRVLKIEVDQAEFEGAVRRFLSDARPGGPNDVRPVTSRAKAVDVRAYAQALRADGVTPTQRLLTPVVPDPARSSARGQQRRRNSTHPDRRQRVVPTDFKLGASDRILRRVFEELRTIDPESHSFAAAYLLRAFVEHTAGLYARKHALGHEGKLHEIIQRIVVHLEKSTSDRKILGPLRTMSTERNARTSPDSLGAWVHGSAIPTGAELKRRWDTLEPGLAAVTNDL